MSENALYPSFFTSLQPYVPYLNKKQYLWLIGTLLIHHELPLKQIQERLDLTQEQTEEVVGSLMQSNDLKVRVRAGRLVLLQTPDISVPPPDAKLDKKFKRVLGYLKGREFLNWEELKWQFSLEEDYIEEFVYELVIQGFMHLSPREKGYHVEVKWKPPLPSSESISLEELFVMGIAFMLQEASVQELQSITNIPSYKISNLFFERVLENAILASFSVEESLLRGKNLINSPRKSVSILETDEQLIVGYVLLRKAIRLEELSQALEIPQKQILKITATLTATKIFPFRMTLDKVLMPAEEIEFTPVRSLDEIGMLSLFNYHMLLGIIQDKKRVSVKQLAKIMEEREFDVLRGIITLTIEGFISGELTDKEVFILKQVKSYQGRESTTLTPWEQITLGMLIARQKVTIDDLAKLLNILPKDALKKAYTLLVKGTFHGTIENKRVIKLLEYPNVPPLLQPHELPEHEKVILGYLYARQRIKIKEMSSYFKTSETLLRKTVYKLTGAGLVRVEEKKKMFVLIKKPLFKPLRPLKELGTTYQELGAILDNPRKQYFEIKALASQLHIPRQELERMLYIIVAEGFYDGVILNDVFQKIGKRAVLGRPVCFNCGSLLEDPKLPCPNCGAQPLKCTVCRGVLSSTEEILVCPSCRQPAHAPHIKEWLRIRPECPYCREKIRSDQLLPLA